MSTPFLPVIPNVMPWLVTQSNLIDEPITPLVSIDRSALEYHHQEAYTARC